MERFAEVRGSHDRDLAGFKSETLANAGFDGGGGNERFGGGAQIDRRIHVAVFEQRAAAGIDRARCDAMHRLHEACARNFNSHQEAAIYPNSLSARGSFTIVKFTPRFLDLE